ncbi:MAG: hypothetical protein DHS20C20_20320 [Ardenticatenaceae bacterium]|nr:MAG: hypothetical protein DHS20C20_20320 [Ardenticatenaceae bacterium]
MHRNNKLAATILFTMLLCLTLLGCRQAPPSTAVPVSQTAVTQTAVPPTPSRTSPPPATPTQPEATAVPTATATATPYTPPEHRIAIRQQAGTAQFFVKQAGEPFVPRGVNYVYVPHNGTMSNLPLKVGLYNPIRTREDFQALANLGYNTVRLFLDACNAGPGCIGDSDNEGLNPAYLDNITDMLNAAQEAGIYILFTSNDLPDQGGYAEQANAQSGETFAGYRNSYYLTPGAVEATKRYWRDLLTGLNERGAAIDWVLGWQLLNEQWMFLDQPPLSLTSGIVETTTGSYDMSNPEEKEAMVSDGLIYYIAAIKAEILQHDPTALVTMGFFAPEIAAPGWYVDTAPLLAGSDLDFFDFHAYPGDLPLADYVAAFGMAGYEAKPILLGEYGAFRHIYSELTPAARAITNWQAESCAYGFDGWLYWTYYPAASNVGDRTWGFVDEDQFIMELLAPANQPDPCTAVSLPSANLAYQKPVTASAALPAEPVSNAVDENEASQWGSGHDAPQWIEVDLGEATTITEMRLLVAQWPAGETIHRILGGGASGNLVELHRFQQVTEQGDWLIFIPDSPIENIQYLRIETILSPSWVSWGEVQVLGKPTP